MQLPRRYSDSCYTAEVFIEQPINNPLYTWLQEKRSECLIVLHLLLDRLLKPGLEVSVGDFFLKISKEGEPLWGFPLDSEAMTGTVLCLSPIAPASYLKIFVALNMLLAFPNQVRVYKENCWPAIKPRRPKGMSRVEHETHLAELKLRQTLTPDDFIQAGHQIIQLMHPYIHERNCPDLKKYLNCCFEQQPIDHASHMLTSFTSNISVNLQITHLIELPSPKIEIEQL
jgi:hypothetical protein